MTTTNSNLQYKIWQRFGKRRPQGVCSQLFTVDEHYLYTIYRIDFALS